MVAETWSGNYSPCSQEENQAGSNSSTRSSSSTTHDALGKAQTGVGELQQSAGETSTSQSLGILPRGQPLDPKLVGQLAQCKTTGRLVVACPRVYHAFRQYAVVTMSDLLAGLQLGDTVSFDMSVGSGGLPFAVNVQLFMSLLRTRDAAAARSSDEAATRSDDRVRVRDVLAPAAAHHSERPLFPTNHVAWTSASIYEDPPALAMTFLGMLSDAGDIVQALANWQENVPQNARKLLSRFGAVRNSAMSAPVQASQWCHPPSWIQPTSGTAYTDPTNAVYLAVLHGMSPRLPWVLLQLAEEKAGDVCEAALGAAYLLLEEDVAPRQLEEQEASALREMRRLLEERVNAQLERCLGVRRRLEEV